MKTTTPASVVTAAFCAACACSGDEESLPPLREGKPPQTFEELWSGYDPRREPLESEILHEWEDEGVTLRVVRFRIGVFKGRKAFMAAVYGFPKGGAGLPGLVQIHGGGQYGNYNPCLQNAKRGYATVSIAWAGRITAQDYTVDNENVALFWAGKTDDPGYRVTTDWGALDAYHAPSRNERNDWGGTLPSDWTLDAVESPRNSPWFLCALGARRALTFLEQQPEVNPDKLGVYGHSMGGKLTVMTAACDARVKAAAPSCGGVSDRPAGKPLYAETLADGVYLRRVTCPILFLSPANDFHGRINDLQQALEEIPSRDWRVVCSAHHNHQDHAEFAVAAPLWFDQHLKGTFAFPRTPESALRLKTAGGVPSFTVTPDPALPVLAVDLYYTQQGEKEGEPNDHENTMARFWHRADAREKDGVWAADVPVLDTDRPLWVYANVLYPLKASASGAGYYFVTFAAERFNLSSRMAIASPEQLKAAPVRTTDRPSLLIESFQGEWRKEWFSYDIWGHWMQRTHKLHDPKWRAPAGAKLALEVCAAQRNTLVVGLDGDAAEVQLTGGPEWQSIVLDAADFRDAAGVARTGWTGIRELRLDASDTLSLKKDGQEHTRKLGTRWQGPPPQFRNLRWI